MLWVYLCHGVHVSWSQSLLTCLIQCYGLEENLEITLYLENLTTTYCSNHLPLIRFLHCSL